MKKHYNLSKTLLVLLLAFFGLTNFTMGQHWSVNGQSNYDTWSIYLDDVTIDGATPAADDELAVFSGTTLVGVYTFTGEEDFTADYQTNYEMVAFTHLDAGAGYTAGDVVTFKFYDSSESEETTGSFSEDVLLNNPADPGEYLDDDDGTLEFPAGDEPYSYVNLAFTSGNSITGTVTLNNDCFADVSEVWVKVYDSIADLNSVIDSTQPNSFGDFTISGLDENTAAMRGYHVALFLDNYNTIFYKKDQASNSDTTGITAIDLTGNQTFVLDTNDNELLMVAQTGDIEVTVTETDGTAIENAKVTLYHAGDALALDSLNTDASGEGTFANLCLGDYILVASMDDYASTTSDTLNLDADGTILSPSLELTRLDGTVVLNINDAVSGEAVTGALVVSGDSTAAETNGVYTLNLPWGNDQDIVISKDNYQQLTLTLNVFADSTINREVDLAPNYFQFEGGNAVAPVWTIYVSTATIDNIDLDVNDEIAIFDDGDTLVGSYYVQEGDFDGDATDRVLKAFSELDNGDEGYTGDETYSIKIYDFSAGQELVPTTVSFTSGTWDPDENDDKFPPLSMVDPYSFLDLDYIPDQTMSFNLDAGYQMISANVVVDDSLYVAFNDVLDNLEVVKNEDANTLREIAGNWVDNIGVWGTEEGYLVKMTAADQLSVTGQTAVDGTVTLNEGFNIISYLETEAYDLESIVNDNSIGTLSNIDFIRDSEGNHFWNINGSWVNNIGNMNPGEGYFVKMNIADELDYAAVPSAKSTALEKAEPVHYTFEGGNPTEMVYTVYIESETLQAGDEVAAFNDGVIVGSTVISNPKDAYQNNLNIFEVLNSGNGFEAGHEMELRVWSPRTGDEYIQPQVEFINTANAYNKSTYPAEDALYSHVKLTVATLGYGEEEAVSFRAYPNPVQDVMTIESSETITSYRVINTVGQVVMEREVNLKNFTIDVSSFEKGLYIIEATINGSPGRIRIMVQ
jgi:hypothetical protein